MERVSITNGDKPILIIAPHGVDDLYTIEISKSIVQTTNSYAVINNGWKRSKHVNGLDDLGNCNSISQIFGDDVIEEEFAKPIILYHKKIVAKFNKLYIFIIHGFSDSSQNSIIIGHGAGDPPSYSCEPRIADYLCDSMDQQGVRAIKAGAGSKYAGWHKDNLNQLFRKVMLDRDVQSMQLEINVNLRKDATIAKICGKFLASSILRLVDSV